MNKKLKKSIAVFLAIIFSFGIGLVSGSQVHAEDFTEKSNGIMKNESLSEENKAVGKEGQNKNLKSLQSPLLKADPVSTKTFTVTKYRCV